MFTVDQNERSREARICRFWKKLYYDELIESSGYQSSYCKNADEPWFNCAHAASSIPPFSFIESYYLDKNRLPAFYTDTLNEQWLISFLLKRNYYEITSQNENIWYLNLCTQSIKNITKLQFVNLDNDIELRSATTLDELKLFIEINRLTNELPDPLAHSLFENIRHKNVKDVEAKHFIIFKSGYPAGCGSAGIYNNVAFLAEDGTLPGYRRQGIHCYSMQQRFLYAFSRKARHVLTTCSRESFTNHSANKLGMKLVCTRRFFQLQS